MVSGDYGAWSGGKDEESCVAVIVIWTLVYIG